METNETPRFVTESNQYSLLSNQLTIYIITALALMYWLFQGTIMIRQIDYFD